MSPPSWRWPPIEARPSPVITAVRVFVATQFIYVADFRGDDIERWIFILPRTSNGNTSNGTTIWRPSGGVVSPTGWNEAQDVNTYGSPEQSVQSMKVVCHELAAATNDPEGSLMDDLVKDTDRLVSCAKRNMEG
ncbi:hypothetical protein L1987_29856 [Smallanthus sonchifolius]|uniref:Uncharacterized protein n=1 Tax=Smallanthus sonchifolius TaxID=185202 RepID=A0ACB9I119_9ASTR|nr:hypothetical protein L1987_29856 [Smallanthus sonchifolius]